MWSRSRIPIGRRPGQSQRSDFWSRLGTPIRSGVRPGWVSGIPRNSSQKFGTPLRRPGRIPRNEMLSSRFSQRRRQTPGAWPRDEILAQRRPRQVQPANIQQDFAPPRDRQPSSSSRPLRTDRQERQQNVRVGGQTSRLRIPRQSRPDRFLGRARNATRPERRFPTGRPSIVTSPNSIKQRQDLRGRTVRPTDLPSSGSRQNSFGGTNPNRFSQRGNSRRQFGSAPTQQRTRDRLNSKVMKSSSPATLSSSMSSTTTPQKTWPIWAVTLVVVSAIVILLMSVLIVMLFKWMRKLQHPIHG